MRSAALSVRISGADGKEWKKWSKDIENLENELKSEIEKGIGGVNFVGGKNVNNFFKQIIGPVKGAAQAKRGLR